MGKKLTQEIMMNRLINKHGNRFDYSKMIYTGAHKNIIITCRKHNHTFSQRIDHHLYGMGGCPKCQAEDVSIFHSSNTKEYIEKAKIIHGDLYDYSKVIYTGSLNNIIIICPIHGEFILIASNHLTGYGCHKCKLESFSHYDSFILRANIKYNNKYDYSKVIFLDNNEKVKIICPIHGLFNQTPNNHMQSVDGCPKCGREIYFKEMRKIRFQSFLNETAKKHNNKYDYSKSIYLGSHDDIEIGCPIHGYFWQRASRHLGGAGCPKCKTSKGEQKVINYLDENKINYIYQHKFSDCLSSKEKLLIFDFFLPEHNLCIEYDGKQHYQPIDYFGGDEMLAYQQLHDKIKNNYCKQNNIKLLRIPYAKIDHIEYLIDEELNWVDIIEELF